MNAKWFVDGEAGFLAMYKALKEAKHTVFITDWFLSPQVHLYRPRRPYVCFRGSVEQLIDCNSGSERLDEEYRLDMVLKDIAEKGVHVRTSARILHSINIV